MQAIIVVDCQNDFSEQGSLPVKGANALVQRIATFLTHIDHQQFKVIFSQDWHPQDHCSFKKWPAHCVANTFGADYMQPLKNYQHKDLELRKGTVSDVDSYSAFYENKNLSKLKDYLHVNHINTIYVCGLVKDICVLKTLNDGVDLGFKSYLLKDLSVALDEKNYLDNINIDVKEIDSKTLIRV